MTKSSERILTSHAGSLPRPDSLLEAWRARSAATARTPRPSRASSAARSRTLSPGSATWGWTSSTTASTGTRWAHAGLRRLVDVRVPAPGGLELVTPVQEASGAAPAPRGPKLGARAAAAPRLLGFQRRVRAIPAPAPRCRTLTARAPVADGPITYIGQEAVQPRHRQPQGGAGGGRRGGGFHERSVAPGELRAVRQRVLRRRRGAAVRVRGGDARGVQGDHRRRPHPAARRSGHRRELGPDQPRALASEDYQRFTMLRVEALNHAIRGLPRGPHPLPPLLGQLARPAHHRHPDARHRRRHARDQRRRLLLRGGQRPPRARVARLAGRRSCRRAR